MTQPLLPLISPEELFSIAEKSYLLIDASFGKSTYEASHLKGAIYADLNADLSDIQPDAAQGGRHPLPTTEQFALTLGKWGIKSDTHVIVYDNKQGSMSAARFWWMLRAAGHEKIQVLDGGFQAAVEAGFPTESGEVIPIPVAPYPIQAWQLPLVNMAETEAAASDPNKTVIDVRERDRYLGIVEPIDLVAGHIPGAVNIPFSNNLNATGRFKSPEELRHLYKPFADNSASENVTVHCGSGVTACHTLLAWAHAGLPIPKLYVGSWSEWSRNDKPIGIGE
ncbi:Thiosulfate sulfurtransferase, rhodanese [Lunatimonas lonarensis]|uniref:Thiosulfate sulfurtransferase, rhodanese n=1 Tax=Lunatimonas lonarensis TaxID=1232681 RepID=R7ZPZ3_9BACT|nr:sulfurtransferase [Lunatimonas lonarensis]EON76157.1 Thiosulfate sulfurtransferase, rhodanese [Lunatimonas lonarensis]